MTRQQPADKLPAARVGSFTFLFATGEFHWSAQVAAMHGYPAEPMVVDADLVLSHKHAGDRVRVAELYREMIDTRSALSSRHRIVDRAGDVHRVVVISKNLLDAEHTPIGLDGFYVDLSEVLDNQADQAFERAVDEAVDIAVAEFATHRAIIEQAKGMVMMAYSIPAERAFDVLKWRSQQSNTKVRTLCELIVKRTLDEMTLPDANHTKFDDILLSTPDDHRKV
jgi:ANTAR domain/PAS fold